MIIRPLLTPAELRECVALQEATWGQGFADRVPYAVLWVARRIGGVLLGAFDGNTMVGFVFGMTGWVDGRPLHWSDMLAVRSDARDRGIGLQLKRAQRELLIEHGIAEANWTFDPLESRNAHLNFSRLGVVAREYLRDVYGGSDSPLHGVIGTDRLVAQWHLTSDRVDQRLAASAVAAAADAAAPSAGADPPRTKTPLDKMPAVNHVTLHNGVPHCDTVDTTLDDTRIALLIPSSIQDVKTRDREAAVAWRARTRTAFEAYLQRGYVVTELVRRGEQVSAYILDRAQTPE